MLEEPGPGAEVRADAASIRRVLAGDAEAYADIVRRWQRPLYELAYRFSGEAGTAEEMAQEALLKAYRALPHWRGEGAFSTWLFAIATNSYRSWLRRKRPATLPIEAAEEAAAPSDGDPAERREREAWVRRAVDELPVHYREAIHLFYFHEMDLAAAAASLGVPEGTLKSQLHRARQLLERRLAPLVGAGTSGPSTNRDKANRSPASWDETNGEKPSGVKERICAT